METMELDPEFLAQQVRSLRKKLRLTQENLADLAGITSRTIQHLESGRERRPDVQTLRSIAKALGIGLDYFAKAAREEEARHNASIERALRRMAMVPVTHIRTAAEFLNCFDQRHQLRFDHTAIADDDTMEFVVSIMSWLSDLSDSWPDTSLPDRLDFAKRSIELFRDLESRGHSCSLGHYRMQRRFKEGPPLIFSVGFGIFLPNEQAKEMKLVLVQLEDSWETLEADRALPHAQESDNGRV